jgi:hypothetical protein
MLSSWTCSLFHLACTSTINNAAIPYISAAITKITRRITIHKNTRSILGKPFSIKGKTQQSFAIFSREDPPHHKP